MWCLKASMIVLSMATLAVIGLRWADYANGCLRNIRAYPPVYQCGIHPLDFDDSYFKMTIHNLEMNERSRYAATED